MYEPSKLRSSLIMAALFSVQVGAVLTIVEWAKRQDQRGR
jgi:hypothetical protein